MEEENEERRKRIRKKKLWGRGKRNACYKDPYRLVSTSDGFGVVVVVGSRKSAYDLVKIEKRSRKRSHKLDGIGVGRIRTFPFSSDSAYDSVAYDLVKTTLSVSEAEAENPTNHKVPNRTL